MQKLILSFAGFSLLGIILMCCPTNVLCGFFSKQFDYDVTIVNVGKEEIEIIPFKINDKDKSINNLTGVIPNSQSSIFHFFYKPYNNITLKYRTTKSNETIEINVPIKLPDDFDVEKGRGIVFYLNTTSKSVNVKYKLFYKNTGEIKQIENQ